MVWRVAAAGLAVEGRDSADLAAAPAVTLAAQSELVRSLATNGAHVVVVSASSTTPANNFLRVYPRAGGAALFTATNPYTPAAGFYVLGAAADGARAYLLTNVDSTGAKVRVRAYNITTGATLWSWAPAYAYASATSPVVRQRITSNGELVAVLTSSRLVVLNASTGAELWTVDYTDTVEGGYHGLSLAWGPRGRLYVGRRGAATNDGLYCYEGATGRAIWATSAIEPLDLVQDGGGLFAAYSSGSDIKVARLAHETGPMLMQLVAPTARHRRPWPKALIPAGSF
jgi:outer membrane protein assembly factor BamB